MNENDLTPKQEKVIAFASGTGILLGLITIALVCPNPTPFQNTVFRIILSLGAGGFGVLLPGRIHVQFKGVVRASSAIALFVLVYLVNPAQYVPMPANSATSKSNGQSDLPTGPVNAGANNTVNNSQNSSNSQIINNSGTVQQQFNPITIETK